jgi:hypothetical protein
MEEFMSIIEKNGKIGQNCINAMRRGSENAPELKGDLISFLSENAEKVYIIDIDGFNLHINENVDLFVPREVAITNLASMEVQLFCIYAFISQTEMLRIVGKDIYEKNMKSVNYLKQKLTGINYNMVPKYIDNRWPRLSLKEFEDTLLSFDEDAIFAAKGARLEENIVGDLLGKPIYELEDIAHFPKFEEVFENTNFKKECRDKLKDISHFHCFTKTPTHCPAVETLGFAWFLRKKKINVIN